MLEKIITFTFEETSVMKKIAAAILLSIALIGATETHAALVAGDVAIIGRTNNGSPDSFTFVPLTDMPAGTVLYFTDNGWQTAGNFRGASDTDGDGNESLTRFTATNPISAGRIIASTDSHADFVWDNSGVVGTVPGAASGAFGNLSLSNGGEQIYAFANSSMSDPMFLTASMTHLFVFDDTNGFENASDSGTGDIPPGLSIAGNTAVTISAAVAGTRSFNTAALASGTKEEWLAAIANSANWTGTTLPSGSITVVPEPSAFIIAGFGLVGLVGLVRRNRRTG
jgi:hypothetical protein